MMRGGNLKCKKTLSEVEVYIQGTSVIICEYYSKGFIEKLLEHAKREYGIIFNEKCRSMCG